MSSSKSMLSALLGLLGRALTRTGTASGTERRRRPRATLRPEGRTAPGARRHTSGEPLSPGQESGSETVQVDPERVPDLSVAYSPAHNDLPDSGEVVWTWVPYVENDGRGKDRPVLVIGRQSATRVFAVRMTSKAHEGDRDFISIGSGSWDSQGRESWVDIEQLYSVHNDGMRREAATLDRRRYAQVTDALIRRYGWARA